MRGDRTLDDRGKKTAREFITGVTWRFARTMPENPHWYVVERDEGGPEFKAFVALISAGETRRYHGWPYRSVTVDDFDYWTSWAEDAGTIINRKPSAAAGWDD